VREGDAAFEALREAIEAFAEEQAPELVAEARAEAVAKVRSMLAEALAQSLLEHSGRQLAPTTGRAGRPRRRAPEGAKPGRPESSTPSPAARRPAPETKEEPGYYVYGVVSATDADLPDGLAGVDSRHPATLIERGGLAAIVSRVSLAEFGERPLHENLNDVAWLETKARAHEAVLDEALARMTVVPMRLCTIYRSAAQVEEMLDGEHDVLADALRRLEGKTEWGVKLIAEPGALERVAAAQGEGPAEGEADLSPGAAYLSQKRRRAEARERADRVAEGWADTVHERLAERASEALLNPLQNPEVSGHTGDMLLNGVYLVDDRDAESFRHVVDELGAEFRELGAAVELTGPWPPYNFVKSSIEAAR
jgi:hypothetical protein